MLLAFLPLPLPFYIFLLLSPILFTAIVDADINQLQLIGTFTNVPVGPFSPSCPEAIRILQVDPLSTNEGQFFIISHSKIRLLFEGGGSQACTSVVVSAPRFGNRSATVLQRDNQIVIDQSNPFLSAFNLADESFFLGEELGPRTCGQSVLKAGSKSIWVAPETIINVPTGDYAINFKPGFKYIYYFSETDPCLFRGNANEQGTVRPVATPPSPSPTPVTELLSPVPNPSSSPVPSTVANSVVPPPDDGVTIEDGVVGTPGPACFPYDAVIRTRRGAVTMGELKVGDYVLVEQGRYSQVFGFTHATRAVWTDFVTVSTSKRTLTLSQGHYIYANGRAIQAKDLRLGDELWDVDNSEAIVTRVGSVTKRGLYNAQTVDGNIVVDGIIVTTYTTALGKMMTAHALLAPIRMLRYLFSVDALLERIRLWWIVAYERYKLCRL